MSFEKRGVTWRRRRRRRSIEKRRECLEDKVEGVVLAAHCEHVALFDGPQLALELVQLVLCHTRP